MEAKDSEKNVCKFQTKIKRKYDNFFQICE